MSDDFTKIAVVDFEYEVVDGGLPNVLCMVAHVADEKLRHVRTIELWRGEFGSVPPPISSVTTRFSSPIPLGRN